MCLYIKFIVTPLSQSFGYSFKVTVKLNICDAVSYDLVVGLRFNIRVMIGFGVEVKDSDYFKIGFGINIRLKIKFSSGGVKVKLM